MNTFDPTAAAGAGVLGGLALLAVMTMGRRVGMTRMNLLDLLGTMMAPTASPTRAKAIGLGAHLMASAGFGLAHAAVLQTIGVTSVGGAIGWDAALGMAHGLMVLIALPVMVTAMHPLVRAGEVERPGIALTGYGPATPVGSIMAHIAFGLITGGVYASLVL